MASLIQHKSKQSNSSWAITLEMLFLFIAAPLLYFPTRFEPWGAAIGIGILALSWLVRGTASGRWITNTPADAAIWFWLLIMLPIALWVAPPILRDQYSWPRANILIWNYCLFNTVVSHASFSPSRLGWALSGWIASAVGIASIAPFGMERRDKLPGIGSILDLFPQPLHGAFAGAEGGFSTNQLAGALLFVLPLLLALTLAGRKCRTWQWYGTAIGSTILIVVMVLAQSRSGLIGLVAAGVTMLVLTKSRGWWLLGIISVITCIVIIFIPADWIDFVSDAPGFTAVSGASAIPNFQFRLRLWQIGIAAVGDFSYTGMGLGTFRAVAPVLYSLPETGLPPDFDLAHAHNFFLQTALDFGIPGLIAVVTIYLFALSDLYKLANLRHTDVVLPSVPWITWRVLAIGWMGVWIGQSAYSMFDAVAIGSKPSFLWWVWLALVFAAGNLALRKRQEIDVEPKNDIT